MRHAMDLPSLYVNEGGHVDHWGNLISTIYVDSRDPSVRLPIPKLVKGCRLEHAIESGSAVKISNLKVFRSQGENLIQDRGEVYVSESQVLHGTIDDPDDMERVSRRNQALNRAAELVGSGLRHHTTSTRRTVTETNTLDYAPKGWLFCASITPTDPEEWSAWRSTLDASYDHVSHIYRPREFARALASMVAEQLGAQSGTAPMASSLRAVPPHQTQHAFQIVFHGPVSYVDDVDRWLYEAESGGDLLLRTVFTKGISHHAQREYRFVVWSQAKPEHEYHLLRASPALIDAMTGSDSSPSPPVRPTIEPIEESSPQQHSTERNPLGGTRLWSDLVASLWRKAKQPSAIMQPNQMDTESLPSDFRARTATYAGVAVLRNKVRDFHEWIDSRLKLEMPPLPPRGLPNRTSERCARLLIIPLPESRSVMTGSL